jgi:hypothetical protein
MTGWQPIETAPKDGTTFEGKLPDEARFTIKWKRDAWAFDYGGCWLVLNQKNQPTHWVPLPPPPKKGDE